MRSIDGSIDKNKEEEKSRKDAKLTEGTTDNKDGNRVE